jgi:diaminopimelate epimerase
VAAIAVLKAGYAWPVTVRTRGGEDLVVSQAPDGSRLYLEGGAVFVFEGDLEID